MKKTKKYLSIILTSLLLLSTVLMVSCGNGGENNSSAASDENGELVYSVTVKDSLGTPYSSGVVVQFMQNGEAVAKQPCDENGVASKTLSAGDYNIELAFTDKEKSFYYEEASLSKDKTQCDIVLSNKVSGEPQVLSVGGNEYDAYSIFVGSTYVDLKSSERSYFLFAPTTAGNYKISIADGANVTIGHYGAPHFVQENNIATVENNAFSLNVKSSMIGGADGGTVVYVIGIDAGENAKNCIIAIQRVGDPIKTVEDEPWTIYEKTVELSEYVLPENAEIKEFDLTASTETYNIVFNSNDGFYHLDSENGPLVLVRLTEDSEFIDSFAMILDRSGVSRYFYDEDGNFVKKESYSECLLEYIDYADETEGVYPLTEDLKYIIQNRGEYVGWWNPDSDSYLFVDANGYDLPDINNDIAWLLMCCYIEG